jgi:hypothetical protein
MVGTTDLLTKEWIEAVARTADNDLRAHRIALTYSRLALHLDDLIHGDRSVRSRVQSPRSDTANANFFHFATWGTLTVSQNIGNQRPPQRLNVGLGVPLRRRLTPAVLRARAADAQVVGRSLAWGQRLIFVSACLALANFSDQLTRTSRFSVDELEAGWQRELITRLTSSEETEWFKHDRHFRPIARSFELYALASKAPDQARARLVLGANLLLTAVEQDLVDPALSFVVDLVPRRVGATLDWQLARLAGRFRGIPTHLSYLVLQSRHEDERRTVDLVWSRLMTDQVLVMALPTETLRLGRDIPPWRRDQPYFPADLRDLGDNPDTTGDVAAALEDVARHVKSLDRTVGNGRGSAARDWRRWDERMNWAVTLMRSRQHDETLFWRPYSEADERRIVAGEVPQRMGDPSALEVQPPLDPSVFKAADLVSRQPR